MLRWEKGANVDCMKMVFEVAAKEPLDFWRPLKRCLRIVTPKGCYNIQLKGGVGRRTGLKLG